MADNPALRVIRRMLGQADPTDSVAKPPRRRRRKRRAKR